MVLPPKPGFDSSRALKAGTMTTKETVRDFMSSNAPLDETIRGLMGCMPVGARHVTYVPAEAVAEMRREGGEQDIDKLEGVQHFSEGPWLDDWSKVPDEIAAKYNTCPTYTGPNVPIPPPDKTKERPERSSRR